MAAWHQTPTPLRPNPLAHWVGKQASAHQSADAKALGWGNWALERSWEGEKHEGGPRFERGLEGPRLGQG